MMCKKKKWSLSISREQAKKAIGLCLYNARSFIKDACISYEKRKIDHVSIPIEFALEEIGKAKIILDKLHNTNETGIILREEDGICVHEHKLKVATDLIGLTLESDGNTLIYSYEDSMESSDPLSQILKSSFIEGLKDLAQRGHKIRLASSFVDFQETGEPILDTKAEMLQQYLMKWIDPLIDTLEKHYQNDSKEK